MSRLQDRLRDLPPERYARGAHAAANLAIKAAELTGRAAPEDAVWLQSQTEEQLREQQTRRLEALEKSRGRESIRKAAATAGDRLTGVKAGFHLPLAGPLSASLAGIHDQWRAAEDRGDVEAKPVWGEDFLLYISGTGGEGILVSPAVVSEQIQQLGPPEQELDEAQKSAQERSQSRTR